MSLIVAVFSVTIFVTIRKNQYQPDILKITQGNGFSTTLD